MPNENAIAVGIVHFGLTTVPTVAHDVVRLNCFFWCRRTQGVRKAVQQLPGKEGLAEIPRHIVQACLQGCVLMELEAAATMFAKICSTML